MTVRFKDLCADAADPARVAAFWADLLGLVAEPRDGGLRSVENRWHWDVDAAEVEGATTLRPPGAGRPWTVMADPQANEFCRFP
ncbi:MAG: hypothetical protein J0I34_01530 [Pseudonocardia sp.]|uniref:VOC family protein n=1 Tax=unclassified Pseudonocardia TaxID=2619320 RepID=UPI00086BB73F|nr:MULTISPECIES: VOC family protein [unclassified Pseudonocardia]MBN9107436.1 hypothetical protein [Pseudonocardia sp.]ODU25653.1 MAG: hypothetical protein ABS80_09345 [Pseudonocardia sp. SCN 72-51]ODV08304.1 MAG: hypothetical protein ABT15_03245 [Pseudonocardia sp. SCN 73-27]